MTGLIATLITRLGLAALLLGLGAGTCLAQWSAVASLPEKSFGGFAFTIDGKAYVGGGAGDPSLYRYDASANTWTRIGTLPGGVHRTWAVAFTHGGKGYLGGGVADYSEEGVGPVTVLDDFHEFDPATNTWTSKGTLGGGKRRSGFAFVLDDKAYIGLGASEGGILADVWEYNFTNNTWASVGAFPGGAVNSPSAFVARGRGYVVGGYSKSAQAETVQTYEFNPTTKSWTKKADFGGIARMGMIAFSRGDSGYSGGGVYSFPPRTSQDMWSYDPVGDKWAQVGNRMRFPTSYAAYCPTFLIGDVVYAGAGAGWISSTIQTQPSNTFYKLAPPTAQPTARISPVLVNFSEVAIGTAASRTVIVAPRNSAGLVVQEIGFEDDATQGLSFTTDRPLPVTLAENEELGITITFSPTAVGSVSNQLRVVTNDAAQPTNLVDIVAEGTAAGMLPVIDLSLDAVDFGSVDLGTSDTRSVTIEPGNAAGLTIEEIRFGNGNAEQQGFTIETDLPLPVALEEGEAVEVQITFEPSATGSVENTIIVVTNDPSRGEAIISLDGEGVTSESPAAELSTSSLEFGSVSVGASQSRKVTVSPANAAGLTVQEVRFGNGNATSQGFNVTTQRTLPDMLDQGESIELDVTFAPTAVGPVQNTLIIVTNDAVQSQVSVTLVGAGTGTSGVHMPGTVQGASLRLLPNPAHDRIELTANIPEGGRGHVLLIDERGEIVRTIFDGRLDIGRSVWNVDISALPTGVYFAEVIVDGVVVAREKQIVRR